MNEAEAYQKLKDLDVLITDSHVVYTSGLHGSAYFNKDAIYLHTELTSSFCKLIAQNFIDSNIHAVIAPVIGGVILSQWVAHHLSLLTKKEVLAVYAEKISSGDGFIFNRGYDKVIEKQNVLLVEDVLNTGGSIKKVLELAKVHECQIVGIGALCNRGSLTPELLDNVPKLYSIFNLTLESWHPSVCPLCKKGVPLNTKVGKAKK